ncbi:MAG TPA: amidohydrolase family protein [Puia sp.]|uniref:amidohydrolase family protein n=1 Tax=Puia sp. TaxID=2045100 RepID=UPI002B657E67|nr:amidohydrolase family protein [Puia sp.]HVU99382.1 amidohydrolase family protein [Puia sp.]
MRNSRHHPRGKILALSSSLLFLTVFSSAQTTFPVNGVADQREHCYAFTHATLVKDGATTLIDATLVIRDGLVVAANTGQVPIPKDAVVIDCAGKYIYPSFIDLYTDYGIPTPEGQRGRGAASPADFFRQPAQIESATKGAYNWNQAVHPETDASKLFNVDDAKAKPLRDLGFGTVLTHVKDGIARGTGVVVTLANDNENLVIVKQRAAALYSLNKGTSTQSYPSSLMGSIALLRQTYIDAAWYKSQPVHEGTNLSLQAWNEEQSLPQIFDGSDKWGDLHGDRIGDEFGVQYIIKAGENEYQRIKEIAATKASYIVPVNYPQAQDLEDPDNARFVSLADMKHWELAPTNPGAFEKAGIPFCLTTADLRDTKQFYTNLRKAFGFGLTEGKALEALTKTPATLVGIYDKVGSLDAGKLANFIITTGPVFNEKTNIVENWVQGKKYAVKEEAWKESKGQYNLIVSSTNGTSATLILDIKTPTSASIIGKDTIPAKFSYDGKLVSLSFPAPPEGGGAGTRGAGRRPAGGRPVNATRLSGVVNGQTWNGNGTDSAGNLVIWSATFAKAAPPAADSTPRHRPNHIGRVQYPFDGYGWDSLPTQHDLLIKNATVWTNEKEGRLANTDVLVKAGKIVKIGKGLDAGAAQVIDGTGKYLAPGIIDEHSHIAAFSINEGAQSVTSEVRIADNLNPEDISIYRQLAGGVTSSHILHGSANTIGGQTQLIKLRWGQDDEGLKFRNWDPFIKFALGENVKRTTSTNNNRFPDTRMGVEEVLTDAFTRARDYERQRKAAPSTTRRDLELDALVEILEHKRFITCHSYVQSEITALLRVADKFGFKVNTFTHILEGYKVADKMKEQGCNASTFSDWWAYKVEVSDAIAYNAAIMVREGLNVCVNSDDAEQARRLNQEAAKSVKYGGLTEDEAFKMVTLNPAKALHVADRVGSIKEGKDADLVLWSDNPLSIYARAEKTIVDGIVYYDIDRDAQLRKNIAAERNRLIQKMIAEKRTGAPMAPATPSYHIELSCGDHDHHDGLLTIDQGDDETEIANSNK